MSGGGRGVGFWVERCGLMSLMTSHTCIYIHHAKHVLRARKQ